MNKVQIVSDYIPQYAKRNDSGCDVRASHQVVIPAGQGRIVPTGLRMAMPEHLDCQLRPRSGLTTNGIVGMFGTIDSGYRGEIKCYLRNFTDSSFIILPGDRIGQIVFTPVVRVEFEQVEELPESDRGESGFGSTGVK